MSEVFTVFYCWQNDTNKNHCRYLIRESLDCAADSISDDSSVPFKVQIVSDTENEPGLCNIPATILRRLRESDAVVSDLTFISKTSGDNPKYCSNPNVLFELGYTFGQIGPERIIAVLNEEHGKSENQIFDLAHHRRPISFKSPNNKNSRSEIVQKLANELESALRQIIKLGLSGSYGGDDDIQHQRQLSEIESYWESNPYRKENHPKIKIWARPKLFRKKRWPDAYTIENLLYSIGTKDDQSHRYPPQKKEMHLWIGDYTMIFTAILGL